MDVHFATIWEAVADEIGEHPAVVQGGRRVSWREYENRAARLAAALTAAGLGPDDKVALYLRNCPEYAEAQFAALKQRCVPVNVNYRYLDDELSHLLDDSDARAVVFHRSLGERIERVRGRHDDVALWIEVDDGEGGSVADVDRYEDVVAAHEPAPRIDRSPDDVYMLYTGGTTGLPKGVMYEIGPFAQGFITGFPPILGIDPVASPDELPGVARRLVDAGTALVSSTGAPLMHGTGVWIGLMAPHLFGATCVLFEGAGFDPGVMLDTMASECVNLTVIVGDAFARPLLRELEESATAGRDRDLSALRMIISSGAMFSAEVKEAILDHLGHVAIVDALGSSEGAMATQITVRGAGRDTARFDAAPTTKLFDENDSEIEPGSDRVGMVATSGAIPFGYYKDPDKSARTFRTIDGVPYSFPGDWGRYDADGTLVLLGRGSNCINTGGEKVYPEEVEEAVKSHPAVEDALVFGVDDDRFGQRVVGVAALAPGASAGADELIAHTRDRLASFKAPRELVVVNAIPRSPSAKADYPAARRLFADTAG